MANVIKIKRSTISGVPGSLASGELALSFDTAMGGGATGTGDLYIGDPTTAVWKIAGKDDVIKLSGIEALADVTANAGAVMEADYNANTILAATADDTPVALTVGASTIVGRTAAGSIAALAKADVLTIINVEDGADVTDATNVNDAGAVMETDYAASSLLVADTVNVPTALSVTASTIVGRAAAGGIVALSATAVRTIINVEDGSTADQIASEVTSTATGDIVATNVQAAIVELESEKIAKAGGTMTGVLTLAADPGNPLEAATKAYVDSVAQGLDAKDSVLNATTANVALTGEQTIDGILTSASRILVKNQTLPRENGIYVTASGAWARSVDANTWDELVSAFVFVEEGTVGADSGWVCTANAGGTLGTTDVVWVQFSQAGSYTADGIGIELVGSEFQLELDGTTLSKSGTGLKANLGGINHDGLLNYDANDHIDHTTVTLTAGLGLAGGGTIAANRTFDLAINTLTTLTPSIGSADFLVFYDTANTTHKKILINDLLDGGTF